MRIPTFKNVISWSVGHNIISSLMQCHFQKLPISDRINLTLKILSITDLVLSFLLLLMVETVGVL